MSADLIRAEVDPLAAELGDVGMVLVDDGLRPAYDRTVAALVHGVEERLLSRNVRLVTRIVPDARRERAVYRMWRLSSAVDAVVLMDVRTNDRRIALLTELDLPFVAVTDSSQTNGFSSVTLDTRATVAAVLRFLVQRGCFHVVHVRAPGGSAARFGELRAAAFQAHAGVAVDVQSIDGGDGDRDAAVDAAVGAATGARCALVFDEDAAAVATMHNLKRAGRRVPEDVAVFAWNDSPLCQTVEPAVSALDSRPGAVGDLLGACLLRSACGREPVRLAAPEPIVVARASA